MGDFFQFPPVRGPPLWKKPRYGNDEDAASRLIWHRFQNVIILDEQTRQSEDPSFCDFLARTRQAGLTEHDVTRLNSRVVRSLGDPVSENATVIVKLNAVRHPLNRIRIETFAPRRSQKIYLFAAIQPRTKYTGPTTLRLQAHDLLLQPDHNGQIPFSGILFYTRDILDLKNDTARRNQDYHRKYCSLYVQLSRLQSFQGLYLLQKVTNDDLRFSPDPDLMVEMERLHDLQAKALAAWALSV